MKLPVEGDTCRLPLSAMVPLHAPLAVHAVVRVDDQVSVELPPSVIVAGVSEMLTAGALTISVAERLVVVPKPLQVSV
ncbi:MAG TPA: hypothetical protein VM240_09535 [Verrucomicrobiae bacterium]|nr:hypothetical protein [Verrucomicrobiae bacterium]